MAVCVACWKETTDPAVTTCVKWPLFYDNCEETRDPIPHDGPGRCEDCGVVAGGYHHGGCERERCPRCGGPLLSCDCPR